VTYSRLGAAVFGSGVLMAAVAACSATSDGGLHSTGGAGAGSGNFGAGGDDIGIITQGSGASGAVVGDGTCGVIQKPEQIIQYSPIALYIMLDRSGSMITGFPEGSAQSWQNSTNAINAFVTDPSSQSIDVGLGFFPTAPDNGWTCSDGTGSGSNCGTPVVEIGAVSKTGPQLTNAMNSNQPNPLNFTPTECGLMGMISHCEDWKKRTGEQCVAILVTDGNPTLCTADTAALSKIVSDGKANGVTTFVLGLPGSNASVLDPLAQAGGSSASIDVSGGVSAFVAALNTIRGKVSVGTALPCQWKIPPTPGGQQFDPQKVNVSFTPKGGPSQDFGHVAQADCSRASNAWYFDDPNQPTQVFVCPTTCDMLKASTGAEVDVSFGCATKQAPLR
jgi:hypothetical protein